MIAETLALGKQEYAHRCPYRQVYELLGAVGVDEDPSDWVRPYERGLAAYRGQKFERALACFETRSSYGPMTGRQ